MMRQDQPGCLPNAKRQANSILNIWIQSRLAVSRLIVRELQTSFKTISLISRDSRRLIGNQWLNSNVIKEHGAQPCKGEGDRYFPRSRHFSVEHYLLPALSWADHSHR